MPMTGINFSTRMNQVKKTHLLNGLINLVRYVSAILLSYVGSCMTCNLSQGLGLTSLTMNQLNSLINSDPF